MKGEHPQPVTMLPQASHLPTIEAGRLALRALERLGFQREGYLRERYLVHGETQDTLLYGLLRREWAARRAGAAPGGRVRGGRHERA